jgi:hypothetical protein
MEVEGCDSVEGRLVGVCDLFPADQLPASADRSLQLIELSAGAFTNKVHEAVAQLFHQTGRRHKRLAIEDDEFFHKDKTQRVEQARRYARGPTRLFQPVPGRKRPLTTLLHPTLGPTAKTAEIKLVDQISAKDSGSKDSGAGFPGSVPVSLMREDIVSRLWDGAYYFVWAPKTNGLRFFAVFCHFGNKPWILFINRSQQVFAVPNVTAPDVFFDGTILDGELVPTRQGTFAYLAYDCAISCGVPCSEYNYLVRLQIASLLIESWTLKNSVKSLEWRVKRVWGPDRFVEMLGTELPGLDHDTDGFMATAVEPPIQIGQTQTIFKIKHFTDHTIDFLLANPKWNETELCWDLVSLSNRGPNQPEAGVWWDTIRIPKTQLPDLLRKLGFNNSLSVEEGVGWVSGRVVECRYSPEQRTWVPEIVRRDKAVPNKVSVAEKTWKNIQESLHLTDVFPKGTLPEPQRALIQQWETKHPNWRPTPTVSHKATHPIAPASLSKLITF